MAAPLTLPGASGTIGARERGKRRDEKGCAMAKAKRAARRAAATDATQSIAIEGGQSVTIGGDQRLRVGGRQTVAVGTDRQATVGGSDHLEVNLDQTVAVDRALDVSVGTTASLEAGRALTLTAARVTLRAAQAPARCISRERTFTRISAWRRVEQAALGWVIIGRCRRDTHTSRKANQHTCDMKRPIRWRGR